MNLTGDISHARRGRQLVLGKITGAVVALVLLALLTPLVGGTAALVVLGGLAIVVLIVGMTWQLHSNGQHWTDRVPEGK